MSQSDSQSQNPSISLSSQASSTTPAPAKTQGPGAQAPIPCNRIVLLVDESGSMRPQKAKIILGVNDFITQQRQLEPDRNDQIQFNLTTFSDSIQEVRNGSLGTVDLLVSADYNPGGGTRLFDGMGHIMDRFGNETGVIMVTATDGQENMSRTYTKYREIADKIVNLKENQGWKFVYLCEDIDSFQHSFQQGANLGFTNNPAMGTQSRNVGHQQLGTAMSGGGLSNDVSGYRMDMSAVADHSNYGYVESAQVALDSSS